MKESMVRRIKRSMAVALALMIGGSGSYALGNVSRAAEDGNVPGAIVSEAEKEQTGNKSGTGESSDNNNVQENGIGIGDMQPDGSVSGGDGETLDFGSDVPDGNELPDNSGDAGDENVNDSVPEDSSDSAGDCSAAEDKENAAGTGGDGADMSSDSAAEAESGSAVNRSEEEEGAESGQETAEADEMAEAGEVLGLEVPEKINLTLDPYEIDGRGQVYSDEYVIRNAGKTKGKLTLYHFACIPHARGEVIVQSARDGIYDSENKAVYLEMVFGNGDAVVFTEDGSGIYEIELEPGEELSMHFTGALSESSIPNWNSGDISVAMSYQWDSEDGRPEAEDGLNSTGGEAAEGDRAEVSGSETEGEEGGDLYSEAPETSEEISDVSAPQDADEASVMNPDVGKEANEAFSGETRPAADAGTEQETDSETKTGSETVAENNSETGSQ